MEFAIFIAIISYFLLKWKRQRMIYAASGMSALEIGWVSSLKRSTLQERFIFLIACFLIFLVLSIVHRL